MNTDSENPELKISASPETAAAAAACGIAGCIRAAVNARGLCTLALSGGRSPVGMLAALARQDVPWKSVHIFQVDERDAPAGSQERNWTHLQACLLSQIDIPAKNVHPMPLDGQDLQSAAREYAAVLAVVAGQPPVLDIVHLGLGSDGHTASLVPNDPVTDEVLYDVAPTQEYQGHRRLTLTYPCLRRARQLVWFVTGAEKAPILARLLQGDKSIPAGRLGHDRNLVHADRWAAPDRAEKLLSPVLAIDVGGSHVKLMDSVSRERRKFESGPDLTAQQMCEGVLALAADWNYSAVSIGIPAPVRNQKPCSDPPHLGTGWVDFDYAAAFGKPLKIMNDAAMQALGSYQHGKTLFLGLGTGLGAAMIAQKMIAPMELAHLPYRKNRTFEDYVGERGLQRMGKSKWRKHVGQVVALLRSALLPEEVILGGGNVRLIDQLPAGCRRGDNNDAFLGGFRLWEDDFFEI